MRGYEIERISVFDVVGYARSDLMPDRLGASTRQHAVENDATDGDLGLLSGERTSPQVRSDQPLVSPDRGFDQRTLAITGGRLPFQPTVACDCGNVLVPLTRRSGAAVLLLNEVE